MNNTNGPKPENESLETYLRDIALWSERMERQKLAIVGQVQRALEKIAHDVQTINSRTPIKICMAAPEFTEALRMLQLRYDGDMPVQPRKPKRSGDEARRAFREYVATIKPGELIIRQDYITLSGDEPAIFDRYIKEIPNVVKVSPGHWRKP